MMRFRSRTTCRADFWNSLKRLERGQLDLTAPHDTRVIMAAANGSKRSVATVFGPESPDEIPVGFEHPDMVVTISPSPSHDAASLRLSTH